MFMCPGIGAEGNATHQRHLPENVGGTSRVMRAVPSVHGEIHSRSPNSGSPVVVDKQLHDFTGRAVDTNLRNEDTVVRGEKCLCNQRSTCSLVKSGCSKATTTTKGTR